MGLPHTLALLVLASIACGRVAFDPLVGVDGDVPVDLPVDVRPGVYVAAYEVAMTATPQTIAIDAVDPSRTFLLCDYRTESSSASRLPMCALTGPTTVTVTTGVASDSTTVRVQVVQLAEGTTVQRGEVEFNTGVMLEQVPIEGVDLSRAFPLVSRWAPLDSPGFDQRFNIATRFGDAQTLELTRLASGNTVYVAWQVVQLPGARVISGTTSIGDGAFGALRIIPEVDLARSFVVASARATSDQEADHLVRAELIQSNTLSFDRVSNSTLSEVEWFVIETPDATVQRGMVMQGTLDATTVPLAAVDPTRAAVVLSFSGGVTGSLDDLHEIVATGAVRPTELEIRRLGQAPLADVGGRVSWSVVEWDP